MESNSTNTTELDEGIINQLSLTFFYLILYIIPTIIICVQIHRHNQIFKVQAGRVYKTIFVLAGFLLIFVIRIILALLFLWFRLGMEVIELEAAVSFWIPCIVMNVEYGLISFLLLLWMDVIVTGKIAGSGSRNVLLILVIMGNIFLDLGTILALALILPFGDSEFYDYNNIIFTEIANPMLERNNWFRWAYFGLELISVSLLIGGFVYIVIKLKKLEELRHDAVNKEDNPLIVFKKRTEIFIICVIIVFTIKIFLDWCVMWVEAEEVLKRTFQFIWHTVPEIVLGSVFMWMTWKSPEVVDKIVTSGTRTAGSGNTR